MLAACMFPLNASAAVLGELTDGGWSSQLVDNVWLQQNIYQSESVGQQTEFVVEYTPNENVVPVVVTGTEIYNRRTIREIVDYMNENNLSPIVGINGDYFSYKTGIPMGQSVIDGEIITKEEGGQHAVAFNRDGTGFIGYLELETKITKNDGTYINLENINKWRQPDMPDVYLLTDRFGSSTQTSNNGWYVIVSPVDETESLSIGGSQKLRIDEKFEYDGDIAIPDGKYVITVDSVTGNEAAVNFVKNLEIGEEITVSAEAANDKEKWANAEHVISSVGGRLVENGVAGSNFETGAAPRTAIGIKENGNIVFYVLDGRQPGYSYGAQLKTLANRMVELGCIDALNMDGGGSTSLMGYFPGDENPTLINSPSDGTLRKVANFIFLRKLSGDTTPDATAAPTQEPTQTPAETVSPEIPTIEPTSEPTNTPIPEPTQTPRTDPVNIDIAIEGGILKINVTAPGTSLNTDYIAITLDGTELVGDEQLSYTQTSIDSVNITYPVTDDFEKQYHKVKVLSAIPDGVVNIKTLKTSGEPDKYFKDTDGHWAEGIISYMAQHRMVNGIQTDKGLVYNPDGNMTRSEFAKIVINYLGLDADSYSDIDLPFADTDQIPQWALNTVKAAVDLGIMQGKTLSDTETVFAPNDTVTRGEAFTILGRVLPNKLYKQSLEFIDRDQVPQWAMDSLEKLNGAGLVSGYEDNTLRAEETVKRSEAAVMLYNIY